MADVSHKDLTGVDLHEPKGVAGASDGDVYIADGAGSGDWSPKGPQVAQLIQTENGGVDGTQPTNNNEWEQTELDTEVDPDNFVTLSSNRFTLSAGTYLIFAWQMFRNRSSANAGARLRLRNITDGSTVSSAAGSLGLVNSAGGVTLNHQANLSSGFSIAATKTFEIQHFCHNTNMTPSHDQVGAGDEHYAGVTILKIY